MAEQQAPWAGPVPPPPGWLPPPSRPPSGLLPGLPPRPRYREPFPIGAGALFGGLGAGLLWVVLFGALARSLAGYAWWTLGACLAAWSVALVLARIGDRGVAVGVAVSAGLGWSVATAVVAIQWAATGDWPMW